MVRILRFILGCAAGEAVLESGVFSGRGFLGDNVSNQGQGLKKRKRPPPRPPATPCPAIKPSHHSPRHLWTKMQISFFL
jgi:hypothetical protein